MMRRRHKSPAEQRAETMQAIIVAHIRFYCDSKRRANIVPARATWRELKFSLPKEEIPALQIFEADLWRHLDLMVEAGYIRRYNAIRYYTYEVVNGSFSERYL